MVTPDSCWDLFGVIFWVFRNPYGVVLGSFPRPAWGTNVGVDLGSIPGSRESAEELIEAHCHIAKVVAVLAPLWGGFGLMCLSAAAAPWLILLARIGTNLLCEVSTDGWRARTPARRVHKRATSCRQRVTSHKWRRIAVSQSLNSPRIQQKNKAVRQVLKNEPPRISLISRQIRKCGLLGIC